MKGRREGGLKGRRAEGKNVLREGGMKGRRDEGKEG